MEQEEKFCSEVKPVREFIYLGDRVSTGGECEVAVTGRTRCVWVCDEYIVHKHVPLKLIEHVDKSYVRPAILYVCVAWCLKERC